MLERHAVDLTALAADVAAQFSVIAPRVAVRAVGGAVTIQGDADRLRQVLVNLVDNALRATREGGEVVIETAREADGARMSVIDTGVGIPPEARARLFDRFYRVDGARDRQAGGTGLGLSIVQALVSAHGGTITLESEVGRGARFDVRLPLGS